MKFMCASIVVLVVAMGVSSAAQAQEPVVVIQILDAARTSAKT